jgi:hypothetical protein
MKALVHIGQPKTGTSSIQSFLYRNRAALAAQGARYEREVAGRGSQIEYPMAALLARGVLPRQEEARLRYRAVDAGMQAREYGGVAERLTRFPTRHGEPLALFSSEHCLPWLHTDDLVAAFDEMFRAAFDEVRYLVYLRRPADLVVSEYSERIKRGATVTFDEHLERRLKALGQARTIERWARVVGPERLTVRLMEPDALTEGDLLADFCAVCGLDAAPLARPERENAALTAPGAEALRVLNTRIPELRPDGTHNPLRRDLIEAVQARTKDGPRLRLDPAQAARVEEAVRSSDARLRDAWFPDRETLFPARSEDMAADPRVVKDQAMEALADLVVDLRIGRMPALGWVARRRALVRPRAAPPCMAATGDRPAAAPPPGPGS